MVAAHQDFILIDGHRSIVEMMPFQKAAALDVEHASLTNRLGNKLMGRRNNQLRGIFYCVFRVGFGSLAVGQQTSEGNDTQHANEQTEETGYGGCQHVHYTVCLICIESRDNQVWRRAYQCTYSTHA